MASVTCFATPVAMATTQFVRTIRHEYEDAFVEQRKESAKLGMSRVVVTDNDGNRRWQNAVDPVPAPRPDRSADLL
jgi:hypothetical protein